MRRTKSWMLGWLLAAGWWPVVGWGQGGREVTIAADDTLMVQVLNGEELSREWRVASSGELNLPLVGRVKVAGLTVGECEQLLAERLRRYQHNPQVTVYVQEFRSHPVSVVGAVDKPGVYQLKRHTTLFDAIVLAGGPKEAGPTVTLTRAEEAGAIGHPQARRKLGEGGRSSMELVVDVKDVMRGRGAEAELEVYPEDVVGGAVVKRPRGGALRPGGGDLSVRGRPAMIATTVAARAARRWFRPPWALRKRRASALSGTMPWPTSLETMTTGAGQASRPAKSAASAAGMSASARMRLLSQSVAQSISTASAGVTVASAAGRSCGASIVRQAGPRAARWRAILSAISASWASAVAM